MSVCLSFRKEGKPRGYLSSTQGPVTLTTDLSGKRWAFQGVQSPYSFLKTGPKRHQTDFRQMSRVLIWTSHVTLGAALAHLKFSLSISERRLSAEGGVVKQTPFFGHKLLL